MKKLIDDLKTRSKTLNLKQTSKPMRYMLLGIGIVFGGIIGFNYLKTFMIKRFFANYEPPAVTVSSSEVTTSDWHAKLEAVGTIAAIAGVDINTEVAGKVTQIDFKSGQIVNQGDPLIDLDDAVEQADLKFNQAQLILKDISYKRQLDLQKKGATPTSSVDEARANLQQAEAAIEKIQAQIKHKHIVAPFSGMLGIRQVNLGEYVSPGQNKIVNLQSLDPLFVEFYIPEQLLKKIAVGQAIFFEVDELPQVLFKGSISAIDARADTSTHNVHVQATIANCDLEQVLQYKKNHFKGLAIDPLSGMPIMSCNSEDNQSKTVKRYAFIPGMFANIKVEQPSIPNTLIIPSTAVSYSLYGNSVFEIYQDKKLDKQGKPIYRVRRKFIQTGEQQGNYTVVKSGLKAQQNIVSLGELKLQNGTRVSINNKIKMDKNINPIDLTE